MTAGSNDGGSGGIRRSLAQGFYATSLYDLTLGNTEPSALAAVIEDPWPGRAETANAFFQGRYEFAGESHSALNEPPWQIAGSEIWIAELHGFAWLRHFRAAGGEAARRGARELIRSWTERHAKWQPLVWRDDVLGRRMAAWAAHAEFLLEGAEPTFRRLFLISFARQSKHLFRSAGASTSGNGRIAVALGMVTSSLALGGGGKQLTRAGALLSQELARQVLADGGHASRNPARQASVLEDLIFIRTALASGGAEAPAALDESIRRMAPMLRFFRHGDGGLALFNGSVEGWAGDLEAILKQVDAIKTPGVRGDRPVRGAGGPPSRATDSGFERLSVDETLVLMDVGNAPPPAFAEDAHAGPLSFEMSIGRDRVVVNCGSHRHADWRAAGRSTAAHSTLTLADTNAFDLKERGGIGKRRAVTTCERNEDGASIWIEAYHDGYAPFGVVHSRRLYLGAGGGLKGEDSLIQRTSALEGDGFAYAVRFHLHPEIQASLVGEGNSVLLRLPQGRGVTFHAGGARLELEESVYLGSGQSASGDVRRSEQIVLSGKIRSDGAVVKWAFVPVES